MTPGPTLFLTFVLPLFGFMFLDGMRLLCSKASKSAKQDGAVLVIASTLIITLAGALMLSPQAVR